MPTVARPITRRLASLLYLIRPLVLIFIGVVLLSLGVAYLLFWAYQDIPMPGFIYYLTLQFLPEVWRGVLLALLGLAVLMLGIWQLSGVIVFRLRQQEELATSKVVLGYREGRPPRIAVLSGGAGMLILSNLSKHAEEMTCITPLQDPIEYYYRASGLFHSENIHYVVPTPESPKVYAELDNGAVVNVMHVNHQMQLAEHYAENLFLVDSDSGPGGGGGQMARSAKIGNKVAALSVPAMTRPLPLTRPARDALQQADVIVLGPGSLFESIIPNLLIDELRAAVQQSRARKIFVCNLMTEPGLTTGFSVGDHIRQIKRYGGFAPDYVLVNVQRIEPEVQQIYAAAHQVPVYLTPEEYEETAVPARDGVAQRQLLLEGSVVIEADLASSVVQLNASINNPGERWAVRVLRHDPEKLTTAILALLRRE